MPARRAAPPPRGPRLFGLAGLIVFAMALGLGFLAGRHWGRLPSLGRAAAVAKPTAVGEREGQGRRGPGGRDAGRTAQAPEPTPTLTFYQELTKPLAPPAPARREGAARLERVETPRSEPAPVDARAERRPAVPAAGRSTGEASGEMIDDREPRPVASGAGGEPAARAFTVQVAAYRVPAQAEALRESLAAAGHDAYVVEAEAAGGMAYRVRVGSFATREAARAAAQAIASERQLQVYVTTR